MIAGKKDVSQRGMERRIIAQLFDSIDYITSLCCKTSKDDIVTTQQPSYEVIGTINKVTEEVYEPKIVILIAATNK